MTRKKSGFLTFIFSLIPGAGEMYMGFFKQGISIMCIFFGMVAMSSYLMMGPLMFLLPVVWFYSFFHVHNLRSLSDEEFYAVEDKFLFNFDEKAVKIQFGNEKIRKILAIVLIVWGSCALLNTFAGYICQILEILGFSTDMVYGFFNDLPRTVFSIAIIVAGVYLIKGKKKELSQLEEISEKKSEE